MYILGVSFTAYGFGFGGRGHNPSACLLKDGQILAAAEEERFIRIKHAPDIPPLNAIQFCLDFAGITLEDIDYVAFPASPDAYRTSLHERIKRRWKGYLQRPWALLRELRNRPQFWTSVSKVFQRFLRLNLHDNLLMVEHHLAHASSAFRASPFKRSAILTMDATGEYTSTLMALGEGNSIVKVKEYTKDDSLGFFYSAITKHLGYVGFGLGSYDEGKVMGLAAYGRPIYSLEEIIQIDSRSYRINSNMVGSSFPMSYNEEAFEGIFGRRRMQDAVFEQKHKDLAASAQKRLEEAALAVTRDLTERTGSDTLCMAGGVALNCKMNGEVLGSPYIQDIFIQPAAGDSGLSIGAALEAYSLLGHNSKWIMDDVYLGPEFSNEEIESTLKKTKIDYEFYDDIAGTTAEYLSKGKIVGWFQGRMELGPRALGNRSILADPRDPGKKDEINYLIKHREPWRPYCPSLLAESADEYLEQAYPSPFMILAFKVRDEKIKEIPAVVHVDGTVRPQTVERNVNPLYYDLIKSFEEITSVPVVLNTSFNVAGDPIVCTPRDAIETFWSTGMDILIIGNYLIRKEANSSHR